MNKLLVLPALAVLASCGAGNGDNAPQLLSNGAVSQQATSAAGATLAILGDATLPSTDFLVRSYQDGIGEIALSSLAAERAVTPEVRRYAAMMVADHTRGNERIAQLAQAQNIALPTTPSAEQAAEQARLSALLNIDFDRAYLARNLVVHEQGTLLFMQQAETGTDEQTRMLAMNKLPLLKTHLAMAEELYASIDPTAYLTLSYRHGLAEILLSQLALTRSTDAGVRTYAQMMIDQHTSANGQIAALAQTKGIALPAAVSPVEQAKQEDMALLSAVDFDKAYMNENVIVHTGNLAATRAQAESGTDADVRNFATTASTVLTGHLTMSMELFARLDSSFPVSAFQKNAGEVMLAHRALESATSQDVQAFALAMADEHTAANNEVMLLAQQEGVRLPKAAPAEFFLVHRLLARASQEDFDQAYMLLNVEAHRRAISFYESRAANEPDPEQRAYAAQKLPTLQAHLNRAQELLQGLPSLDDLGSLLGGLR